MTALEVAVLSYQVESRHPVVTLQAQRGPGSDEVADDVWVTLRQEDGQCYNSHD